MNRNKKIRVLHIITRLIRGGADENTIYTVEGLDKNKYDVDLIIGIQSEEQQISQINSCRIFVIPELVRELSFVKDLICFFKIVRIIRKNKYHIVHTHTAKAGMLGRFAAFLCRVPVIVHTLHGSTFHDNLHPVHNKVYLYLERLAAKVTDKIITVGNDLKKRYILAGVGSEIDYVTIRSGFHIDRFLLSDEQIKQNNLLVRNQYNISPNDIVIGSASRLEHRKGHIFLFDAIAKMNYNGHAVKVLLAGDGDQYEFLKNYCKNIGLNGNVIFLGHRNDIEQVMSAIDIFVLTSLWEGLPRVLVQAAALGKPIVTFDIEGAQELVKNKVNGFVVPLKDTDSLREKCEYLINDIDKAKDMGKLGQSYVTEDWMIEKMVEQIEKVYSTFDCCI